MMESPFPKNIWMLWLQGWETAPETVQACAESWRRRNPGWRLQTLDRASLAQHLDPADTDLFRAASGPPEALSDRIRIALLLRHGGVWADGTALCVRPLDGWLPAHLGSGFFAFERPVPDRMIASWFLAATQGSVIVQQWHDAVRAYWAQRTECDDYFWFHELFAHCYAKDTLFREAWDSTPKLPAMHRFHFGPDDPRLTSPPTREDLTALEYPPSPVLKLTYKLAEPAIANSLIGALRAFGRDKP
jgi:hypothetical protein